MKYRAPETARTGGGNWLTRPGTYHVVVTAADETPRNKNGETMDAFRVTCQALEGTVCDDNGKFTEKDKTVDLMFWHPKLTDKNEGMFARQKQAKFFLATGQLTEDQLGSEVDIELDGAVGRQLLITLEERDGTNGRSFLDLHFADIWHIDDPAASQFPRCDKSIALIPQAHRRAATTSAKATGTAMAVASNTEIDLDDL